MLYASELIGVPEVGCGGGHLGYCYSLGLPLIVHLSLRVPIYVRAMCPYPSGVLTDKPYSPTAMIPRAR